MRWLYLAIAVGILEIPVDGLPYWARALTWVGAGMLIGRGYLASERIGARAHEQATDAWDSYTDKMHNRLKGERS